MLGTSEWLISTPLWTVERRHCEWS